MQVPLLDLRRQNLPLEAELARLSAESCTRATSSSAPRSNSSKRGGRGRGGRSLRHRHIFGNRCHPGRVDGPGHWPGDEVICPSFTFFATAGCIRRSAPTGVRGFLPGVFQPRPRRHLEPLITTRTKAIVPVHLFGQAADIDPILEIARRHGLAVIEDAAQAFGAEYRGRPVGSLGHFATVSFFPTKNLGALGDAGLLVTDDPALAEKARLLRNHGCHPPLLPRHGGRQLPPGCLAGRAAGGEIAASGGIFRAPPAERQCHTRALAPFRHGGSVESFPRPLTRIAPTSSTSTPSACAAGRIGGTWIRRATGFGNGSPDAVSQRRSIIPCRSTRRSVSAASALSRRCRWPRPPPAKSSACPCFPS